MEKEPEVWVDVKGYEGLYKISNWGNLKSYERTFDAFGAPGRTLTYPEKDMALKVYSGSRYYYTTLSKNGKKHRVKIHRLVASHFVENPDHKPFVDHDDTNTFNNYFGNLKWATAKENMNNPLTKIKHRVSKMGDKNPMKTKRMHFARRCVECGAIVSHHYGVSETAREMGIYGGNLSRACKNKTVYKGYRWEYITPN